MSSLSKFVVACRSHCVVSGTILPALTKSCPYSSTSIPAILWLRRNFSSVSSSARQKIKADKEHSSTALEKSQYQSGSAVSTTLKEKVKENVETTAYGGVIVIGIAITAAIGYFILSELFSSDSPNSIYTKSYQLCQLNSEVRDALGEPLKCYGEETRRGWRRHVAHQKYFFEDTKYIRMKFYIEGKFNKGTVYLEKKTDDKGKFKYTYLVVDLDTYPSRRIEVDTLNV